MFSQQFAGNKVLAWRKMVDRGFGVAVIQFGLKQRTLAVKPCKSYCHQRVNFAGEKAGQGISPEYFMDAAGIMMQDENSRVPGRCGWQQALGAILGSGFRGSAQSHESSSAVARRGCGITVWPGRTKSPLQQRAARIGANHVADEKNPASLKLVLVLLSTRPTCRPLQTFVYLIGQGFVTSASVRAWACR